MRAAHGRDACSRERNCVRVSLTKNEWAGRTMAGARQRGIAMALMLGVAGLAAVPAAALRALRHPPLGRARGPDDAIEVIDPLPYTVTWRVAGGEDGLQRRLETASSLWTDRETPGLGQRRAARQGARRLPAAARRRSTPRATTGRRSASAPPARRSPTPTSTSQFPPQVPVVIDVAVGPRFRFGARRDRQRAAGRGLRARRHRDAGGGRLPPGRDRAVGASSTRPRRCRSSAGGTCPAPRRARPTAR